jgi:hypothetical protein
MNLKALKNNPGGDLLSHTDYRAVPSAQEGLTSEFGMGSGVAPPVEPPETGRRDERVAQATSL